MGFTSAAITSTARSARKIGVRILPTWVRILPGLSENASTTTKNTSEKIASASDWLEPAGIRVATATVKGVVAQRGMAKKGPMVRYSAQVKK